MSITVRTKYKCAICRYGTYVYCNYERHMISKIHVENVILKTVDYKYVCICNKYCCTKESYENHKTICCFEVQSDIHETLLKMQPMNMKFFIDNMVNDKDDIKEKITGNDAVRKLLSLLTKNIVNIPVNERPFHNFNEDGNNSVIHYYTEDEGWKCNNVCNIITMNMIHGRSNKLYNHEYNSFMYFIEQFYDNQLQLCIDKFGLCSKMHMVMLETYSMYNKTYFIQELMKLIEYDYKIKKKIGFIINTVDLKLF